MLGKRRRHDAPLAVARYRIDHPAERSVENVESGAPHAAESPVSRQPENEPDPAGQPTLDQFDQYVEVSIQQAMRRGDFDGLPGAGRPLTNLTQTYDPNWWIRRKIEREHLTGLGPPALTLRVENEHLDAQIDQLSSERAVREILCDFNRRVVDARRQLLGGPPVITPTRDVDAEIESWRQRRDSRIREADERRRREEEALARLPRRERRRARRRGSPDGRI